MKHNEFDDSDLIKLDTSDCVILNCGGPLLNLECFEGDNAIVSWDDEGKTMRRQLPIACLSRLVRLNDC